MCDSFSNATVHLSEDESCFAVLQPVKQYELQTPIYAERTAYFVCVDIEYDRFIVDIRWGSLRQGEGLAV